jgi:benzoyl-CoA reductase/2-hydroxyglutaryl-CoA dehydratase subunit BcrC/BadD/HgdB
MGIREHFLDLLTEDPDPKRIRRGISLALLKALVTPKGGFSLRADKRYTLFLYDHARRFFSGKRGVLTSLFAPTELVYAFGLVPFSLEMFAGLAAAIGIAPAMLARSDSLWISTDLCSFHRAYMGLADAGLIPKPRFLLATSQTCDGTFKSFSMVSHRLESPLLFLDSPYEDTEEGVRYLAGQLLRTKERMEEITGRKLRTGDLEKSFSYSNRAREVFARIGESRKTSPPVAYGDDFMKLILAWGNLFGNPKGEKIFSGYLDEIERRRAAGGSVPRAKRRVLWLHLKPYFENDLVGYVEKEHGAVVVFEEINQVYWDALDIRNPYESLARKLLSNYWVGPLRRRIEKINHMIDEYEVDGVIHFAHWGCRQSNGAVRLLKDAVLKKGIPFLNIDADCIEEKNLADGQMKTRIDGFMELIV